MTHRNQADSNRKVILKHRPTGEPQQNDFELVNAPIPQPREGEVLLRTLYLSIDPYMRGRMNAGASYIEPVQIDETMCGGTVSRVVLSRNPNFSEGEIVLSYSGWQDYALSDGKDLKRLDPASAPLTTALGILGMPGMTAYTGLLTIGEPKPGETVVVAAATGPVGSAVGQIAKIKGCYVVGIAGGREKCQVLKEQFGLDTAIDHKATDFPATLQQACPKGIDIYFESVGGHVWAAVQPLLNKFARIPVCGLVAHYNENLSSGGGDRVPTLMTNVLHKRLLIRGFIVSDFSSQAAAFYRDMSKWLQTGRMKYLEDVREGLENAPRALIGLLRGENFGKLIIHVAP